MEKDDIESMSKGLKQDTGEKVLFRGLKGDRPRSRQEQVRGLERDLKKMKFIEYLMGLNGKDLYS